MDAVALLRRVIADLEDVGARFSLVGGFAVSVRTEPRFTADIDLAIAVKGDEEAETICRELVAYGYRSVTTIEHESFDRLAAVRLARVEGGAQPVVDLLFASSGVEQELIDASDLLEVLPGLTIRVASVGHLLALKLLSTDNDSRPMDAIDLRALRDVATAEDWHAASDAVMLIEARGFHRNRDLTTALQVLRDN